MVKHDMCKSKKYTYCGTEGVHGSTQSGTPSIAYKMASRSISQHVYANIPKSLQDIY